MNQVFFIDFDGTVTDVDTCDAMMRAFAGEGCAEINRRWERKEISTEECARSILRTFKATLEDHERLLDGISIDPYFPGFLDLCRERGYPVYLLSDGYDFNIEYILKKAGLKLPYYANRLIYRDGFDIAVPYGNPACGRCGTCKSGLMERLLGRGGRAVYIGDGYSDTCPAEKADLVFAKGKLLRYCRDKGIPAVPFDSFQDVTLAISGE